MNLNFNGVWKANLSLSKFLTLPPVDILVTIVQSENAIQEEMIATNSDGKSDRVIFKCKLDRDSGPAFLNETPIRACARWERDELLIESVVRVGDREMHFRDFWSLSPDSQTLTMEHRNDALAGQLAVFERAK
jgi:hypothetical protein